ncbi:MAG: ABC transporter ATP-binding protein [Bacilli bacterium]|jgi:ABC-2 type transport system ATP-binding protein|nr:ABC transporter ATP-binding protein [Bacilli bacterium]
MREIKLINIKKKYNKRIILNNINYTFKEGNIYQIVGSNGCGKTTLLKVILGYIKHGGFVENNFDDYSYIPDKINFPSFLKVGNYIKIIGYTKGLDEETIKSKSDKLLNLYNMNNAINYKLNQLSKGMKQKVLLICGFLSDVDLYIFDEALSGLDKEMQKQFMNYIKKLKIEKKTIIYTTHYEKYFRGLYDVKITIKDGIINEKNSKSTS